MTEPEQRWTVPTAEQVAADQQHEASRQTGKFAWVRKLRMRAQVGTRRSAPKSQASSPLDALPVATEAEGAHPQQHSTAAPVGVPEATAMPTAEPASPHSDPVISGIRETAAPSRETISKAWAPARCAVFSELAK